MPEQQNPFSFELGVSPEILDRHAVRNRWLGIGFLVLGVLAILLPGIFTIGFQILLGVLLLIGGIFQIINAVGLVGLRGWRLPLFGGILTTTLGALFLIDPFKGAAILTVLLAALFFISGCLRMVHGWQWRGVPGAGWEIFSGLLGIFIAILVFAAWPTSSVWFIGILIGVDFLVIGILLNVFASAFRKDSHLFFLSGLTRA